MRRDPLTELEFLKGGGGGQPLVTTFFAGLQSNISAYGLRMSVCRPQLVNLRFWNLHCNLTIPSSVVYCPTLGPERGITVHKMTKKGFLT